MAFNTAGVQVPPSDAADETVENFDRVNAGRPIADDLWRAAASLRHTPPVAPQKREAVFVLIHSPLVGPASWSPVAHELERRGREALVHSLLGVAEAPAPQWPARTRRGAGRHLADARRRGVLGDPHRLARAA
jgi:hypothetical protein